MKNDIIKIKCPETIGSKEQRIGLLFEDVKKWVYSKPLVELIVLYGGKVPDGITFRDYVIWLNEFVEIWDFRKKHSNGGERWTVKEEQRAKDEEDFIFHASYQLGLIESIEPQMPPDYILPLGGARLANLTRVQHARVLMDQFINENCSVVALSGKRPINEIEIPYLADYAPNAATEYDAVNGAIEKAFKLVGYDYNEENFITENVNLQWSKRKYFDGYQGHPIYSLAAPSTEAKRRANSLDTFKFFMEQFDIREGQRLLLVTSNIYVPFQLLKFIPLCLEKNIVVDCVGSTILKSNYQFSNSNYLQEIKATVNAIKVLVDIYM